MDEVERHGSSTAHDLALMGVLEPLEQLEGEVTSLYGECGFTYSDPCQTLLLLWQATSNRYHLMCHAPYLEELGRFLKDQDD